MRNVNIVLKVKGIDSEPIEHRFIGDVLDTDGKLTTFKVQYGGKFSFFNEQIISIEVEDELEKIKITPATMNKFLSDKFPNIACLRLSSFKHESIKVYKLLVCDKRIPIDTVLSSLEALDIEILTEVKHCVGYYNKYIELTFNR